MSVKYQRDCTVSIVTKTDIRVHANFLIDEPLEETILEMVEKIRDTEMKITMPINEGVEFFDSETFERLEGVDDIALEVTATGVSMSGVLHGDTWIRSEEVDFQMIFQDLHPLQPFFGLDSDGNMHDLGTHRDFEDAREASSMKGLDVIFVADEETARKWFTQMGDLLAENITAS